MVLLPLPAPLPLPFTCGLCADFVLVFTALGATGMHEGKCTDLDLVLGLPALDIDAVGLSAIRHSTICQNFVATSKIVIEMLGHQFTYVHRELSYNIQ